jgi:hypothetical protein
LTVNSEMFMMWRLQHPRGRDKRPVGGSE